MEIRAITRYVRISPAKAGDFSRVIQGKPVEEALAIVELSPRKAARLFGKTLRSALANAVNNHDLKKEHLKVKSAVANPGPMIKRFRPKARGMAGKIRKRMSHFTVVLTDE
jgi:large subunit ribosomal protein L22